MECDEKIGARIRQFMDDCNTFYEQGQLSKARDSLFEAWGILPDEKYIYVEPVGDFPYSLSPSRTIFSVTVNKNTEKMTTPINHSQNFSISKAYVSPRLNSFIKI